MAVKIRDDSNRPEAYRRGYGDLKCDTCWAYEGEDEEAPCAMYSGYIVRKHMVCDDWERTKSA